MSDARLPRFGRRRLLGSVVGLSAVALSGCTALPMPRGRERTSCVARGELVRRTELAGLPLAYEVDGRRHAFWFDADFADRLEQWLADLREVGLRASRLWTYGAWTDGGRTCDSWHDSGRAFDLARIELRDGRILSCRYDQWQSATGRARRRAELEYWSIAASLHRRFAYVVAYPYNTEHHNHVHIDNGRSGRGPSEFNPGSPTQVQAVQAISTHVLGRSLGVTGRFDAATERALAAEGGWDSFLAAAAARLAD